MDIEQFAKFDINSQSKSFIKDDKRPKMKQLIKYISTGALILILLIIIIALATRYKAKKEKYQKIRPKSKY